jgi:hypothetical protein
MSEMWVAVSCGFGDAVFSHRAQGPDGLIARDRAVHYFDLALDESAWCVRAGLAGWLPLQWHGAPNTPLSEHEKLREIGKIVNDGRLHNLAVSVEKIKEVLNR